MRTFGWYTARIYRGFGEYAVFDSYHWSLWGNNQRLSIAGSCIEFSVLSCGSFETPENALATCALVFDRIGPMSCACRTCTIAYRLNITTKGKRVCCYLFRGIERTSEWYLQSFQWIHSKHRPGKWAVVDMNCTHFDLYQWKSLAPQIRIVIQDSS